ncbi:MAG: hypothetical protein K2Q03_06005 [Sphingobacteriaceae bacterium]|nr:hypothetical protein [Sphingobacteriaceae bacterium]
MAQNKLSDLNNHLFAQLERLGEEDLSSERIDQEIKKSKAISGIAAQIIKSSALVLEATKMVSSGEFTEDKRQSIEKKLLD